MPLRKENSLYPTPKDLWASPIMAVFRHIAVATVTAVDPCAGTGYMIDTYFPGGLKYDIEPRGPGVVKCDMEKLDYGTLGNSLLVISNIPFNASCRPIRKLNYIAQFKNVKYIAVMIASKYHGYLRDSYDKKGDVFNEYFHPIHTEEVPANGFPNVKAQIVFQIYERRDYPRSEPKTIFKIRLGNHIKNKKFTVGWKIERPSKAFLRGQKGKKGRTPESPVTRVCGVEKSKPGMSVMYAFLRDENIDIMFAEETLHDIVRHSNKEFHHGAISYGPGHVIQAQIQMELML